MAIRRAGIIHAQMDLFANQMVKRLFSLIIVLCLVLCAPFVAGAEDLSPGYSEALQLAISHSADPSGWQPASLYVIPDGGGTEGLVIRCREAHRSNATKSGNFKGNYVGQAGYKIYGTATTEAAWVTVGNDATRFLSCQRSERKQRNDPA